MFPTWAISQGAEVIWLRRSPTFVASPRLLLALAVAQELGLVGQAGAQAVGPSTDSARGGVSARAGRYRFDVDFFPTGLRVFPRGEACTPIDASKLLGTATFYHPNSPKPWFARPLRPGTVGPGRGAESLDLTIPLGTVLPTGAKVGFEVADLPSPTDPKARFTVPFGIVPAPATGDIVAPRHPSRGSGGLPPLSWGGDSLDDRRFGDALTTRRGPGSSPMGTPPISPGGYGRAQPLSPGGTIPYVSGHAAYILPDLGRHEPTARPRRRPFR